MPERLLIFLPVLSRPHPLIITVDAGDFALTGTTGSATVSGVDIDVTSNAGDIHYNPNTGLGVKGGSEWNRIGAGESLEFTVSMFSSLLSGVIFERDPPSQGTAPAAIDLYIDGILELGFGE